MALHESHLHRLTEVAERRATTIRYFLEEREEGLRHAAASREVATYFENLALGMSMEYGLRASLFAIQDSVDRLREGKLLADRQVHRQIVLVDERGEPLVVSGSLPPEMRPGGDSGQDERPFAAFVRDVPLTLYFPWREGDDPGLVMSVPVSFKEARKGQVLGWIPLSPVLTHLIGDRAGGDVTAIALESRYVLFPAAARTLVPAELQAAPPTLPDGHPTLVRSGRRGVPDVFAVRIRVPGTPLSLVTFTPAVSPYDAGEPRRLLVMTAGLAILILAAALGVVLLGIRNSILKVRLEEASLREKEVAERNRLLEAEIDVRQRAEEALRSSEERYRQLNAQLEERVRERTAQLQVANRELEAFSYTVSHDLRSPLRAIDGFSARLVADHGSRLDGEGLRLLGVVRASARKMSQLIADLLAFSRLGRTEPRFSRIDMKALADAAARECLEATPSRDRVSLSVGDLPEVRGDEALLRQVWVNLLSNALKFSGGRERPVVTVEGRLEGETAVFSVRDNGAGFDMAYAGKLFGVFARLHGTDEFEGTGVGLAIVHRIVVRHGGRVWAESTLGEGAAFHFSLPVREASFPG